jgi:murein DD-endopeptidase MepM/ murein hydrolase activator NlpD
MYLPDGVRNVKQIKIPKFLIHIFTLSSLAVMAVLAWAFMDYHTLRTELPSRHYLLKENQQQKLQLAALSQKIDAINAEMVGLKEFDHKLKVMVNLETDENDTQFLGVGGSDPTLLDPEYTIEKAHQKLVRLMHQSLDNLNTEIAVQMEEKKDLFKFLENQKSMLACTPSIWPIKSWVTSKFGFRKSPFTQKREFHSGLDISARTGSPIIAPADGVVAFVGQNRLSGNFITINHGYGMQTSYLHLNKALVKKDQYVKRGDVIAQVGNTGRSTNPHLHYEVHLKGVPVNPEIYLLD